MNLGTISLMPLVPLPLLLALSVLALALIGLAAWRGLAGWAWRGLAFAALATALAQPSWRQEERAARPDVALVVVDRTSSQGIAGRPEMTAEAEAALQEALEGLGESGGLTTRVIHVGDAVGPDAGRGSLVFSVLKAAMADYAPDQIAGALIVSDGRIDDPDALTSFPAPVHLLQTGQPGEWDRRLVLETAPAFGIMGEGITLVLRVENLGAAPPEPSATVPLTLRIDGADERVFAVRPGEAFPISFELPHAGPNVLELTLPEAAGELTPLNNRAVVSVNGIRDRLRVLLVSGEPYAGERTWRNLLKADPAVELVHFTILRPPSKQDGVPVFELSLIAFPTRELFLDKIEDFDLIIFDRYRNREVLPNVYLENVVNYVRGGGALLVASGPAFAGAESLFRSPLGDILPAAPTGEVVEEGFAPRVTDLGLRHPVTAGLADLAPRPPAADGTPGWGRWFRLVDSAPLRGQVVMTGAEDRALLVLDRVDEGRIAQLASDHAWLWSRGFEGGGPQLELLRRVAHWLMKEPELEEDVLTAEADAKGFVITRRSLEDVPPEVTVTGPDGGESVLQLVPARDGTWTAALAATDHGIYHFTNGETGAAAALGPAAPREYANPLATVELAGPLIAATGGAAFALAEGLPDLRLVREGGAAAGRGWAGLTRRGAYDVTGIRVLPMTPPWLMLALSALCALAAWRREGR